MDSHRSGCQDEHEDEKRDKSLEDRSVEGEEEEEKDTPAARRGMEVEGE